MVRIGHVLLLALAFAACQEKDGTKDDFQKISPGNGSQYSNQLVGYAPLLEACQSSELSEDLLGLSTPYFSEGFLRELAIPAAVQNLPEGLVSPEVSRVQHGLKITTHSEVLVDNDGNVIKAGEDDWREVVAASQRLRVCRSDFPLARPGIASAAMTTISLVHKTAAFYRQLPRTLPLEQVSVEVFAEFVDKIKLTGGMEAEVSTFFTDNAGYATSSEGGAIVIFPRSKEALQAGFFTALDLWESPMIIAHEFSHHIFRTYAEEFLSDEEFLGAAASWSHGADLRNSTIPTPGTRRNESPVVALTDAAEPPEVAAAYLFLGALDEGFADLFAFYSQGDASSLLAKHTCLEKARDIYSSKFSNGRPKALTLEVLRWFADDSGPPTESCDDPDFGSIHTIGSIWAHGVARLLQGRSPETKATILLDWLESFMKSLKAQQEASTIVEAVDLLLRIGGTGTPKDCEVVQDVFPGVFASETLLKFKDRWQALRQCQV